MNNQKKYWKVKAVPTYYPRARWYSSFQATAKEAEADIRSRYHIDKIIKVEQGKQNERKASNEVYKTERREETNDT